LAVAIASQIDKGERQIDRRHLRATICRLDRERAGVAASVQHAKAGQVGRQPAEERRAHAADRVVRGEAGPGLHAVRSK
jgi:hypothetical protein